MENNLFNSLNNGNEYNENREHKENRDQKKGFNFSQKKKNTIKSLSEVEAFLRDFKKITNSIKLYKILK